MKTDYIDWQMCLKIARNKKMEGKYAISLLFFVGAHMGLRWSDLSQLKYSDILNKKEIKIIEQKTGKKREIPIRPAVREFVEEVKQLGKYRMDDYLFRVQIRNTVMFRQQLQTDLKLIAMEYELPGNISTHSFRKTFGRRIWSLSPTDETILMLSEIFNHTDPAVTRRYLGLRKEEINRVYESL